MQTVKHTHGGAGRNQGRKKEIEKPVMLQVQVTTVAAAIVRAQKAKGLFVSEAILEKNNREKKLK